MTIRLLKQYPLLFRLVCSVLGFFLLVALLVSALQLWMAYNGALDDLHHNLDELQESHQDPLANSLWNLDQDGVEIQLQSMLQYPDVTAVVLEASGGDTFSSGQVPENQQHLLVKRFNLTKKFNGQVSELGVVTLYATTSQLKKRLWQQVSISLVAEFFALLLTGGFILGIFLLQFNRHINRIAEFAERLEIDTLDQKLQLDRTKPAGSRPDELDRIVFSLNDMRKRLKEGIDDQQRIEHEWQREKKFSDAIINSLPGIFVVYDEDMQAVRFNDLYLEKLGASADNVHKNKMIDRIVPEHRKRFLQVVRELFVSPHPLFLEVDLLSLDNTRVPHLITGRLFELDGKKYLIGLSTDISDRKKIEEELRRSQKMEAIGTLAGGIAHDFNNILAAIMGNLQLAQAALSKPEKLKRYLQSGLEASMRARDLTGQILSISRRGQQEKQPLQVSLVVKEALQLLRASIPSTIDIRQQIDSDGLILADATQIHQVVMNLCTNGYQAMQETGGQLSIILGEEVVTKIQHLPSLDLPVGHYLRFDVTDTGCGMDEATKEMIFEPYFTTNKSGAGTGLGLAVVNGIVQGHNGYITVYSEPGHGTTFKLFFPLLARPDVSERVEMKPQEVTDGNERVLVVDDEQNILDVFSELLRMHGYIVTTFLDSREALRNFREDPQAYDLVITDMTMPGLTGDILGKKIMAVRPEMPVILCTGFSKTINREQCLRDGFAAYLTKPVEARHLLLTLREVLDAPSGTALQILLVEDDSYNQQIASLLLQQQGHKVVVAEDGEVALQKLAEDMFDGIFMDIQMPVLDGLQTTEIIRACENGGILAEEFERRTGKKADKLRGKHVPVIAMTGSLDDESRRQCHQAGMDDFLAKPFTLDSIARALQNIVPTSVPAIQTADDLGPDQPDKDASGSRNDELPAMVMAHLQAVYPLESEQLQQLLDESVRSLNQSLRAAEQAVALEDLAALSKAAHKAKGTLLGLGLDAQVKLARALELSAGNEEQLEYSTLVKQLTHSLQSLLGKEML